MPSHKVRGEPLFFEHAIGGNRTGQNRRLCVGGKLQVFLRTFKAHFRDGKSQRFVGFVENGFGRRIPIRQFFAHSRILRSLSGENERYFAHFSSCLMSFVSSPVGAVKRERRNGLGVPRRAEAPVRFCRSFAHARVPRRRE